jgi:type IV secretion system protein VirB10
MNKGTAVAGERTAAQAVAPRSLAVRLQRVLAATLILALGAAVLVWYYAHLGNETQAQAARGATGLRSAIASEMKLPALETPRPAPLKPERAPGAEMEPRSVVDPPAAHGRAAPHAVQRADRSSEPPAAAEPTPRQLAPVLVRLPAPGASAGDALTAAMREAGAAPDVAANVARPAAATLADALQPTVASVSEAGLVPSRRWLLPKGSFLDCTLETAIDSTYAGLATCILATDVFGADGRVVLLERGTKLVGETRSDVRAGQSRVAVLWNEARTPTGVALNLVSPGTDALGRAGVPGSADRHFGERFGAAVLLSVVDAAVDDFAARRQGSGAVVYNAQGSHDVATEALRNTVAIPPTIRVAPGARVVVTVVRDIDFRAVYRLAPHEER